MNTKNKKRVSALVRKYVYEGIHNVDKDPDMSEQHTDMIMEKLYKDIWEMNSQRIEAELYEKYESKVKEEQNRLENEYKSKERTRSLKSLGTLLFDGIIIATLVGLLINQVSEIILIIKESLELSISMSMIASTMLFIGIIIVALIFTLGKHFVDGFSEIYKQINEQ